MWGGLCCACFISDCFSLCHYIYIESLAKAAAFLTLGHYLVIHMLEGLFVAATPRHPMHTEYG